MSSADLTYARLIAGPDGTSHVGEGSLPFRLSACAPPAPPIPVAAVAATQCVFLHLPGNSSHVSPV
jgi:hypothetical protein